MLYLIIKRSVNKNKFCCCRSRDNKKSKFLTEKKIAHVATRNSKKIIKKNNEHKKTITNHKTNLN